MTVTADRYTPPSPGSKIIVVGGGCFGLSTAYALALKKQYQITVFDRQPIPSPDAASTDINKIVRMDYANDTLYMHLAVEAFGLWDQWNKERAKKNLEPVFHQNGVLLLSGKDKLSDFERNSIRNIREAGYGHFIEEYKCPEEIIERFPAFEKAVKKGYNTGYLNKAGGWCNSSEAVKHIYNKCIEEGVQFVIGEQKGCLDKVHCDTKNPNTVVGIKTKDGQTHYGDLVLLTTGSWTAGLVDMHNQVVATGQQVIHFQPPENLRRLWEKLPVWLGDISNTGFYGFPCNADGKLKVGRHHSGYLHPRVEDQVSVPRTQVTNATDTIPISTLREFREFLDHFLPETTNLDITFARMCWYSDSIDGDFVIGPHPQFKNMIVACGDSGHAMKFIPVIGFKIREIVEGRDTEYSHAWAWRNMDAKDTKLDGIRADSLLQRVVLCEPNNDEARMATEGEFKAHYFSSLAPQKSKL
ncbi:FAD dependent oxidoreductase [Mycotypha africana]|uniref:FAD dependent oxidoreductase n=1 Tax=Mycotypha africana TaxID=64632 RepID=UPI0023012CB1|nr:FAD dependent oxidoreductase [Mycotypha africana]KAI8975487.1 FAD dependent oxidoreductase [Mycotypha africana]